MQHKDLELLIVDYIKANFISNSIIIISEEQDKTVGKEKPSKMHVEAIIHDKPWSCYPDVYASSAFDPRYLILGEAKTKKDFLNKQSKDRHIMQIKIMLNVLKNAKNVQPYLIYSTPWDIKEEAKYLIEEMKSHYDAYNVELIMINELDNPNLYKNVIN